MNNKEKAKTFNNIREQYGLPRIEDTMGNNEKVTIDDKHYYYLLKCEDTLYVLNKVNIQLQTDLLYQEQTTDYYKEKAIDLQQKIDKAIDRIIEIENKYGYILDDVVYMLDKENK